MLANTNAKDTATRIGTKRELSSGGLTNEETASDGSVEPSTPDNNEPPRKKQQQKKKTNSGLQYLLEIAEWYNSNSFSKQENGEEESPLTGRRGGVARKEDPYDIEQRAEQERQEQRKIINREKLAKKKELKKAAEEQAKRERKEKEKLKRELAKQKQKAKELRQAEKKKELAEKKKKEQKKLAGQAKNRNLKKQSKPSSSSATPDPESSILKSRKTKEVKPELVDGYRPFLNQLVNNVEIPIRDDFFVSHVYNNTTDEIQQLEFTPASTTIRSYLKKYRNYKSVTPVEIELNSVVFPQLKEKYYLMESRDFELDPLEEIGKLMESLSVTYFPKNERLKVYNPSAPYKSIAGKLSKGMDDGDENAILNSIKEYNNLVAKIHERNGFVKHLQRKKTISRAFVHELLNQMYSRAVSPSVQKLKKYEAFSNNVYGELLPNFLSKAFDQVGLSSKSTFIDLGSGVGNVTIQAALEYGCESYGCEVMENASELADLQHQVFDERCRLFGLNPGKVGFFNNQSFVANAEVEAVIKRCDVILVNNYIFTPDLNKEVIKLFKGLKPGTKIISLKNLVPAGYVIDYDDIENIINKFKVECFSLENGSVSWTDRGGVYYVSEILEGLNEEFFKVHRGRRSNH